MRHGLRRIAFSLSASVPVLAVASLATPTESRTLVEPAIQQSRADSPGPVPGPRDAKDGREPRELHDQILRLDKTLFDAFNICNADAMEAFFAEDVEFYHDKGGLTRSREALMRSFREKFEDKGSRVRRELVEGSLEVYPVDHFGAIEVGTHRFLLREKGREEKAVAIARFVNVWRKADGGWKITRALSYDHQDPQADPPGRTRDAEGRHARVELRGEMMQLDKTLFDAFNACDVDAYGRCFAEDAEFYHDKGGLTISRAKQMEGFAENICGDKSRKVRRELVEGSLEAYPLDRYGAVEVGTHRFYQTPVGRDEGLTGIAKFIVVWRKKDGDWRITRALSYDHVGIK